jgi:hypothetical protein
MSGRGPARGADGDRPRVAGQPEVRSPQPPDNRPGEGCAKLRALPALTGEEVRRLVYEHYHRRITPRRDRLD